MSDSVATATTTTDIANFDRRITFHDALQVMEADFSGFHFADSATVNQVYDRIEDRIAQTGEPLWFFLVNLHGTRIDPPAWVAYARRGRALNMAHSMGSVRFDPGPETAEQIRRAARTEAFDPNLCADRDAALARLAELPSKRTPRGLRQDPTHCMADFVRRIAFDEAAGIMEVDFSHFTFHHSRDVDDFYDHIEARIADSGRDWWYFLIDYDGCRILPAAWVRYAHRGKMLNVAHSLGSVRYAPGSETATDIRLRAESQGFRPNIRNTRAEALARIDEMKGLALA